MFYRMRLFQREIMNNEVEVVLKQLADAQSDGQSMLRLRRDMLATGQSLAVWGVGIATPGILGILANASELRHTSRLSAALFAVIYALSEVVLIGSVVIAVVLNWFLTRQLGLLLKQTEIQLAHGAIFHDALVERRAFNGADEDRLKRLERAKRDADADYARFDKLGTLRSTQFALLGVGYVLVATLFATSVP